jgi:hypothetical protein
MRKEKFPVERQESPFKYMALSPNFFGFGPTVKSAQESLNRVGGDSEKCGIYRVPQDYWIDELGDAHGSAASEFISGTDYRKL